jgi:tRNA modification GTPase
MAATESGADMHLGDTIVAVSSPAGAGDRAVLRLSGPHAIEIAGRVFKGDRDASLRFKPGERPSFCTYTACAGRLAPQGTGLSVPATLYVMRAPKSYTREDVVEFHIGAWPAVVPMLLEGLMAAGARAADPGEFTFRAFVGGRLDLAQAEAVMAVIDASNEAALRAAEGLLAGRLSQECSRLAEAIRDVLVWVEVDLDFSDQDLESVPASEIAARLSEIRSALADLGRRSRGLETFGGEVRLVLAGWPNVGKSSLFNRLLAADRAIVSPEAGTTRDELRAALHVGGLTFSLSDVAGLREARDEGNAERRTRNSKRTAKDKNNGVGTCLPAGRLEGKVRAKAIEALGRADLVLLVLDATADAYDRLDELLALVAAPMVVAVTKCDLLAGQAGLVSADRARAYLAKHQVRAEVVATSAVTGEGLDDLRTALVRAVEGGTVDREAAGPVVTARHRAAFAQAVAALARAGRLIRRDVAAGELAAVELRESLEALETVVGRGADRDVLDEIFSRFCIGK